MHSTTHRRLPRLADAEVQCEVIMSRRVIERETGVTPDIFAYPYGLWDEGVRAAVRAAGYRAAVTNRSLRAEIKTDRAIPSLSHWFESSVPGLYFVGLTSLRAFGPLYRFVAGCGAAARRVADSVARKRRRRSRTVPKRDGAATLRSETPAGQV